MVGVKTSAMRKYFNPVENLKIFENNQNYLYYPIAAVNKALHQEILKGVK